MISNIIERLKLLSQRLLTIIVFLLIWEILSRTGLVNPFFVPSASATLIRLGELLLSGVLLDQASISLQRASVGFVIAALTGIPLGFLVGWFRNFEIYIGPLLQAFRQIPILALFPVFILIFGIGEISMILIVMLSATWWILINTIDGVKDVDPFIVKMARSMGASQLDVLRKVVLPSTVPSIFTGLRYAYTEVIQITIAVEMQGAETGLGVFLISHQYHGQSHILMHTIIVFMTMLGVIANYILVAFERNVCNWKNGIEID